MKRRPYPRFNVISLGLILILLVCALSTGSVSAQDSSDAEASLGLSPVGIDGAHFDLTLSPGATHEITVRVRNSGDADGHAYLYLADVSTRVNGGLGVGIEPAIQSPATWIDFMDETIPVEAGSEVTRTLEIHVPDDATPGEHVTSIVMQGVDDDTPEPQAGMMLRTVSRQAIAIIITVDGPVDPGIELHTAEHAFAGNRSVVSLTADNTGNVRLRTAGEVNISSADGQPISTLQVAYDPVFAFTNTRFEVPLESILEPGDYIVSMQLENERYGIRSESGPLPLHVPEPPAGSFAPPNETNEDEDLAVIETQMAGIPTWALLIAIPLAILAGAAVVYLAMKRKMQPQVAQVQTNAAPMQRPPVVTVKRVPVRQIVPPSKGEEDR